MLLLAKPAIGSATGELSRAVGDAAVGLGMAFGRDCGAVANAGRVVAVTGRVTG